ncbi:ParA family protein [Aggregatilinea lenta]|uniref:ParA family protein n=1 Tax=Aggregatilinea lenta TaxID=913108 RepID=UPI000E5ABDE9|nr:ParA family protein [Aggregatilinea lenta]
MKILTFGNQKGGVGKTTGAVTVAAGLATRGHSVLLVDAEEQGHATVSLGVRQNPALYDLLVKGAPWRDVLHAVEPERYGGAGPRTNLYLIGSNVDTRKIATNVDSAWILAERLSELAVVGKNGRPFFDYVIIDTAPTPGDLHALIYLATDYLLCPTELEYLSLDGVRETLLRIRAVRAAYNKELNLAGIIPNKFRAVSIEHRRNLEELNLHYPGQVWNPIPQSVVWSEAPYYGVPVFAYVPNHDAAGHAWELIDEVEAVCNG